MPRGPVITESEVLTNPFLPVFKTGKEMLSSDGTETVSTTGTGRSPTRYKGLEEILNEDGTLDVFARFARGVGEGRYKDNQVLLGLVVTIQLATERRIRGMGMQNFKYPPAFREWGALIRMSSPRTYRNIAQEFRMESECSIKNRESKRPRFPIGITDETFDNLKNYCDSYGYPPNYPLCISVDDTKLLPVMHPIYNGLEKIWMLVGLPGTKLLTVATPDELERLMDMDHSPATKIKAPELVVDQLAAMNGLVERRYRFISTSQTGNIFINTQDAPHARKTGRNNIFSGARGLILGDFPVYYKQLLDLAVSIDDPPLYERDVIRADKQDDRAANRVFSAATLQKLTENTDENMGLIVYLFVIGDLVDAYESRSMTHANRAKAALRAQLFLDTWKQFLKKQGYSQARHYLSPAADNIYHMLVDGLLGLIIIHRDHLPCPTIPLLPWKNDSTVGNEHIFAALRDHFPDMTLAQVMFAVPHLRATMQAAKAALFSKASLKDSARGYSFFDTSDDTSINFANLVTFPTDQELTALYGEAIEENHLLWSLLNPVPSHRSDPAATEDAIVDLAMEDELQHALTAVQAVVGLRRGEEEEVDACAYAAAALVIDNLARIDDLPELEDPEQLEQSRKDIARIIKMTPETVEALPMGLKTSFGGSSAFTVAMASQSSPSSSISNVTTTELEPLVSIQEQNQTEHARKGVQSYKAGCKRAGPQDKAAVDAGKKKNAEPTPVQVLARRIQAVAMLRMRPQQQEFAPTAVRRRRTVLKPLWCHADVAEAGIAPLTPLKANDHIFVIEKDDILLARVITIYSKGGGKAGKHEYVPSVDFIGHVSYVFVQTFAYSGGQIFQCLHSASATLGISQYAHLPNGSILLRIPDKFTFKCNVAEELQKEKKGLVLAVITLNTVQQYGQTNANIADIEEEDNVQMMFRFCGFDVGSSTFLTFNFRHQNHVQPYPAKVKALQPGPPTVPRVGYLEFSSQRKVGYK
ncbi:hypothetical protein DFH08DRAFT_819813 [Mycena albidolilacea]|uniref:Uncharacterized protein n=1 Tax=Mycena albidolilacea TaxID=1033008 RepID=A0AAD6ZDH1_9AGAR|nr:hypothetical protein DFH08DRAFT_819813 [Mycena albidolilacea]